jgi:hypothetical protein
MLILAKRYCSDPGFRSSTSPLWPSGCLSRVCRRPVRLRSPRASPQPADREKSPWVTQPRVTLEQWEVTLGRGSGQRPRVRDEVQEEEGLVRLEEELGSGLVRLEEEPGSGPGLTPGTEAGSDCLAEEEEEVPGLLWSFLRGRLTRLLKWSVCRGSWGPVQPGSSRTSWRSSAVGTHTRACCSGWPLATRERRIHTRLLPPCAERRDAATLRLSCGVDPGLRDL